MTDDVKTPVTPVAAEVKPATPAATPEVTATVPPEAPKVVEPVKPEPPKENYQHLLREKNRLRKEQDTFKADRAKLDAERKEIELAKSDPWAYLQNNGITYEQLIDRIVKGEPIKTEPPKTNPEIQEMRDKFAAMEQQRQQEIWNNEINAVANLVKTNDSGERWALIRDSNQYEAVISVILEKRKQDLENGVESPENMSWDKAADIVERYLEHKLDAKMGNTLKIQKIRAKFDLAAKPAEAPKAAEVTKEPEVKQASESNSSGLDKEWQDVIAERRKARKLATLSNSNTSATATSEQKPLTREERKKLAIAKFGDKLIS